MQKEIEHIKEITKNGNEYDDMDRFVDRYRNRALRECRKYNFLINSENKYDLDILKNLFNKMGENVYIESNFNCELGFNISMGNNIYINHDMVILDCSDVTIGNDVYIGPRVALFCANHAEDPIDRANHVVYAKPIYIGDKVWLGGNVSVLQGVSIGENTIIGAGSVVTKDIPPNVIAAGNPCKVIRPIREKDRNQTKKDE
ncbi:acetyltransferase [Bacillus sp. J14TS2]|uniref:sugar O-acetyltransferase n=1 Tax=Bacillus sp. J14TS2 TaxID=2807188 RepID=UPI001AFCD099|nr:sugar O-acetyltransferase [Bacillus sp. J14TS2]GIN70324.1 acetyltransferase [Bacillus sp. J14TS2]